jgi:hypothetical protein
VRVRTSLIPFNGPTLSNLDTRFTLCWAPPRVHHCSDVRSQLGCFDSVCQSPDISLQRWVARRSCLVAAIKLIPSFVSYTYLWDLCHGRCLPTSPSRNTRYARSLPPSTDTYINVFYIVLDLSYNDKQHQHHRHSCVE